MFLQRVVDSLTTHDVRYALAGGYAVALHGAVRGTVDVDVVIPLAKGSFLAAEKALLAIGLISRLPVSAENVFDFREEYIKNKNLVAWSFYNPANPLEVVDILITADLAGMHVVKKSTPDFTINVVSIDDLISLKQISARPQDVEDIKALKKLR